MRTAKWALVVGITAICMAVSAKPQSTSQTFNLPVTPAQVAVSNSFNNVGQSAHQLFACISGEPTPASVTIELEGSNDGSNYFAISKPITLSTASLRTPQGTCGTITANGYFAAVHLQVSGVSGTVPFSVVGVYSGSVGTSPVGGEVRAASAAQKVSAVAIGASYINTALKSTPQPITTNPSEPASQNLFAYGISVYNPNSSVVYAYVLPAAGTGIFVPVAGSSAQTVTFPNPVQAQDVLCSSGPDGTGDPTTGCVVDVMYTLVPGATSQASSDGTVIQTDNSTGNVPY